MRFSYFQWSVFSLSVTLAMSPTNASAEERQVTTAAHGHILTNTGVWSPDGEWLVYDVRSDPAGDVFDGNRIERVHVKSGRVEVLFESQRGANCGVATYSPAQDVVAFIHGPEHPEKDWQYSAFHRRGVLVDVAQPGQVVNLDARDVVSPFTAGALRGGTHVHTFSGDGNWIAFTYEDHVLASRDRNTTVKDFGEVDLNQRNVGVSVPIRNVAVPRTHPRNHNGTHFSVLVTRTTNRPQSTSDEISKAFSDAWVGRNGYLRLDGTRQEKAIAFQGHVETDGPNSTPRMIAEVFIVDIPRDVTKVASDGPLQGTETRRPRPPMGTVQRRLTFTADRKYPGIQGVRHWLRSSPDGSRIAFLMKDNNGVSQLWTISPNGGSPSQVTRNEHDIGSAFSWSPDGRSIAHVMDESVCATNVDSGKTERLTKPNSDKPLRPESCVFSPDGSQIAYVRQVPSAGQTWNQIFVMPIGQ